jgi:transcriptional regulator with XRE-family HTH domain
LAGAPALSVSTDADLIAAIGSLTRRLRREKKLSQFRLAKAVGSTRSHISKIERGLVVPTIPTVARLASALGIDIAEFFLHLRRQLVISEGRIECSKGQVLSPASVL